MVPPDRTRTKRRRAMGLDKQFARLGKEDGTLKDLESNKYWVRPVSNSGALAAATTLGRMPGAHFRVTPGRLVELRHSASRELLIAGEAEDGLSDAGRDTFAGNFGDPASRGMIRTEQIGTLLCRKHPGRPWVAQVLPGGIVMGTTWVEVAVKTDVDLSSEIPASGNHCFVAVFLEDSGGLVYTSSTPQANDGSAPLGSTDVQECIDALAAGTYVGLRAFTFDGDETDFTDATSVSKDLRFSVIVVP